MRWPAQDPQRKWEAQGTGSPVLEAGSGGAPEDAELEKRPGLVSRGDGAREACVTPGVRLGRPGQAGALSVVLTLLAAPSRTLSPLSCATGIVPEIPVSSLDSFRLDQRTAEAVFRAPNSVPLPDDP